jgi:hypothetical protein
MAYQYLNNVIIMNNVNVVISICNNINKRNGVSMAMASMYNGVIMAGVMA